MKRTAVYQGTFDPFTSGHLSVVRTALTLFDEVIVLLLISPAKTPLFSVEERLDLIKNTLQETGLQGVCVEAYEGLLADYMRQHAIICCVRGVRNERDTEYELENHRLSRVFYPELQTVLLPCELSCQDVSSSAVKAACAAGRLPAKWVPQAVAQALKKKFPSVVIF